MLLDPFLTKFRENCPSYLFLTLSGCSIYLAVREVKPMRLSRLAQLTLIFYLLQLGTSFVLASYSRTISPQTSHQNSIPNDNSEMPVPCEGAWVDCDFLDGEVKGFLLVTLPCNSGSLVISRWCECIQSAFTTSRELLNTFQRLLL